MIILFQETQKFNPWLVFSLFIGLSILPAIIGEELELVPCIIYFFVALLILSLFAFMKLKTSINTSSLYFSFFPFIKKNIKWSEVEKAKVIDYGFIGGWGIRLRTGYGTVYNTRGSKGLFIKLKNGKRFIIGTQKKEELETIITSLNLSK